LSAPKPHTCHTPFSLPLPHPHPFNTRLKQAKVFLSTVSLSIVAFPLTPCRQVYAGSRSKFAGSGGERGHAACGMAQFPYVAK